MKSGESSAHVSARLFQAAREALRKAYAPYSHLRVGAAVLTEKGNLFTGANVENASYGLTICAERAAILAAVAQEGEGLKIHALAVVDEDETPLPPCGACRQVMWEFGTEARVYFRGRLGVQEVQVADLLPESFPAVD